MSVPGGAGHVMFWSAMAFLVVSLGGQEVGRYELKGPLVVGRSVDADVSVRDASLSRWHCRLIPPGTDEAEGLATEWTVVDLGSRNGTNLNGRRIRSHRLQHGDLLRMGRLTLFFSMDEFVPSPPAVTPEKEPAQGMREARPRPREPGKVASDGTMMSGANVQRFPRPLLVPADRLPRPVPGQKPSVAKPWLADLEMMSSPGWSRHLGKSHPVPPSPSVDHRAGEIDSADGSAATLDLAGGSKPQGAMEKVKSFFSRLLRR